MPCSNLSANLFSNFFPNKKRRDFNKVRAVDTPSTGDYRQQPSQALTKL
jgi:hypothetical protein